MTLYQKGIYPTPRRVFLFYLALKLLRKNGCKVLSKPKRKGKGAKSIKLKMGHFLPVRLLEEKICLKVPLPKHFTG